MGWSKTVCTLDFRRLGASGMETNLAYQSSSRADGKIWFVNQLASGQPSSGQEIRNGVPGTKSDDRSPPSTSGSA